jgi:glutamine cyclotransferase
LPKLRILALALTCLPLAAWSLERYGVEVLDKRPQARDHFVQGLEFDRGQLYVSTGNYGESRLLRYDFDSGELENLHRLDPRAFAEGLTVLGDTVYQLTWRNRTLLTYRRSDLTPAGTLPISGEGWGLANNGRELIYSDGSATLRYLAADSASVLRSVVVRENGRPVRYLNELEWIDGRIWANVWRSNRVVIIDPDNGEVRGSINLEGLLPFYEYRRGTDVLNGIARDARDGGIWVTGKRWPWLYRIQLVPEPDNSESGADSR